VQTPFLAVDADVMGENIARTQAWADARGLLLRPHVKTHKSVEIARLQVDAGASGITVATIGEAEVFADAGFDDLFIAYPLWPGRGARARLRTLAARARVLIGIDSLDAARGWVGSGVRALVEVDSGHHRSGVLPPEAGELARSATASGLEIEGVFTFPGHSYSPTGRAQAARDEADALAAAAASMMSAGIEPIVISGGSTPSLDATGAGLNEVRPGVYVFNDAQQWELGSCIPEQVALTCHSTAVSHAGGRLVLDAGTKVLGADRPAWASGFGRLLDLPGARIVLASEHHIVADLAGAPLPPLGSVVRVVPNHACNAVNLVDVLEVFESGRRVASWSVAARGRNG
jgi:D-serine deaminase-like pyridoxal phosphate-dependent protein